MAELTSAMQWIFFLTLQTKHAWIHKATWSLEMLLLRPPRITRFSTVLSSSAFISRFISVFHKALAAMTGLDHSAFWYLLDGFLTLLFMFTPYSRDGSVPCLTQAQSGRPRGPSNSISSFVFCMLYWGIFFYDMHVVWHGVFYAQYILALFSTHTPSRTITRRSFKSDSPDRKGDIDLLSVHHWEV